MFLRKNSYYLALICFIFLCLAISYQLSDTPLKRIEQAVLAENSTGVYKENVAVDFQLLNSNGEKLTLSNYRGKKVIINFFATWCGPCQEEMPVFVELDRITDNQKLIILGVNMTKEEKNPNQVREFAEHFQVEYEVLYDGEGKVMKDYQLIGIPTTIFIDEKGKIVERFNGILTMDMLKKHRFLAGIIE
ncbi:TlpA disulfide reductase family protein [Bacillaceae bacterium IKA-2]|nr:TlpA disulfide reductase family protein [Bacillaceae bacterium IKA-2]